MEQKFQLFQSTTLKTFIGVQFTLSTSYLVVESVDKSAFAAYYIYILCSVYRNV